MTRLLISGVLLMGFVCTLPGCGGNTGNEAVFEETQAQTADEVQDAEAYEKMLQQQEADAYKK